MERREPQRLNRRPLAFGFWTTVAAELVALVAAGCSRPLPVDEDGADVTGEDPPTHTEATGSSTEGSDSGPTTEATTGTTSGATTGPGEEVDCVGYEDAEVLDTGPFGMSLDGDAGALEGIRCVQGLELGLTNLADLGAAQNLERVEGSLFVRDNESLETLAPLGNLRHVGVLLRLDRNPQLRSLDGLGSLEELRVLEVGAVGNIDAPGPLVDRGNDGLMSLEGLGSVTSLDRILVGDNDELVNLDGLESLQEVGSVQIVNNPRLPTSEAEAFRVRVSAEGSGQICGNLDGKPCNWVAPD